MFFSCSHGEDGICINLEFSYLIVGFKIHFDTFILISLCVYQRTLAKHVNQRYLGNLHMHQQSNIISRHHEWEERWWDKKVLLFMFSLCPCLNSVSFTKCPWPWLILHCWTWSSKPEFVFPFSPGKFWKCYFCFSLWQFSMYISPLDKDLDLLILSDPHLSFCCFYFRILPAFDS